MVWIKRFVIFLIIIASITNLRAEEIEICNDNNCASDTEILKIKKLQQIGKDDWVKLVDVVHEVTTTLKFLVVNNLSTVIEEKEVDWLWIKPHLKNVYEWFNGLIINDFAMMSWWWVVNLDEDVNFVEASLYVVAVPYLEWWNTYVTASWVNKDELFFWISHYYLESKDKFYTYYYYVSKENKSNFYFRLIEEWDWVVYDNWRNIWEELTWWLSHLDRKWEVKYIFSVIW